MSRLRLFGFEPRKTDFYLRDGRNHGVSPADRLAGSFKIGVDPTGQLRVPQIECENFDRREPLQELSYPVFALNLVKSLYDLDDRDRRDRVGTELRSVFGSA